MPFKPDSTAGGVATRATKLTSVSSFKLYAYNSSGTAIADGVTYTKSGSSWTTTSKVFWPKTGNVTFYAFSPASNSSVSFNTTSKTLTYTAPTGESSQQDVLYAYLQASNSGDNTATLTFNHANAAFSVNARLASGCTATVRVSGVSLVNVKPTNTLTFTSGSASASGSNITSALACSAKTLTTSNQAISSSPLIIPPQTVTAWAGNNAISSQTGAYLAVTCKVQSNGTYVVGSSSANGTVYVPMSKALTKGQDNSVNLVFGTLDGSKRYYGRDANGNRISAAEKIYVNGHEAVDLGLSVKWATENVSSGGGAGRGSGSGYYEWSTGGIVSNLASTAAKQWGGTWSVPTSAQFQELINNCNITNVSNNGYKFTSKINGNSITLSADGYGRYHNGSNWQIYLSGSMGAYWSTSYAGNSGGYGGTNYGYDLSWGETTSSNSHPTSLGIHSHQYGYYFKVRLVCP